MVFQSDPLHVVILAHRSLLSGGLASKLGEYSPMLKVRMLDFESPNVFQALQDEPPAVIILDAHDSNVCQRLPIARLMEWAPQAMILRLDLEKDSVRVFSSIERKVTRASDLLELIQNYSKAESEL